MAQHRVFVSYAPTDSRLGERLTEALAGRGIDLWYEHDALPPDAELSSSTRKDIASCDILLVLLSQAALLSPRVQHEMEAFLDMVAEDSQRRVIPVRISPCKIPPELGAYVCLDVAALPFDKTVQVIIRAINKGKLSRRMLVVGTAAMALATAGAGVWWLGGQVGFGFGAAVPTLTPLPPYLPASLATLGYTGKQIGGTPVILPPLRDVPAGPFLMGSDRQRDPQAQGDELPQATLTLPAFQIATFPVTVAEYVLAVQTGGVRQPVDIGTVTWDFQLQRPDHPVVNIALQDALAYATWLAQLTGKTWRLPTEAEWEKSARGTDGRIYPWGDQWDNTRANTYDGGPQDTTPVGSYSNGAGPYGVEEMAGNVYAWCTSLYKPYPYSATDGREDLSDHTADRVLRGGSWIDAPTDARCAYRYYYAGMAVASSNVGMRLVLGG